MSRSGDDTPKILENVARFRYETTKELVRKNYDTIKHYIDWLLPYYPSLLAKGLVTAFSIGLPFEVYYHSLPEEEILIIGIVAVHLNDALCEDVFGTPLDTVMAEKILPEFGEIGRTAFAIYRSAVASLVSKWFSMDEKKREVFIDKYEKYYNENIEGFQLPPESTKLFESVSGRIFNPETPAFEKGFMLAILKQDIDLRGKLNINRLVELGGSGGASFPTEPPSMDDIEPPAKRRKLNNSDDNEKEEEKKEDE